MRNWIDRFKQWFQIDEETEKEEFEREADGPSSVPIGNRNLSIRTAAIYPKNKGERRTTDTERKRPQTEGRTQSQRARRHDSFSFPLIPDEPKQEERKEPAEEKPTSRPGGSRAVSRPPTVPRTTSVPQEKPEMQQPNRSIVKREGKRPFRPTEVISPVYGRRRPDQQEEEASRWKPTAISPSLRHPLSFKEQPSQQSPANSVQETIVEKSGETENQSIPAPVRTADFQTAAAMETPSAPDREQSVVNMASEAMQVPSVESEPTVDSSRPEVRITYVAPSLPVAVPSRAADMENLPPQPENESLSEQAKEKRDYQDLMMKPEAVQPSIPVPLVSIPPSVASSETYTSSVPVQVLEQPHTGGRGEPEKSVRSFVPEQSSVQERNETETIQVAYHKPSLELLAAAPIATSHDTAFVYHQQDVLARTLANFNVNAEVIGAVQGPTVTRYEIQPAPGVKVNKITNLIDDIKLSLAARDIRIEAPIPGRSAVGIEVPNEHSMPVYLRSILETPVFQEPEAPLTVALGVDIGGEPVVVDLAKMPHGLIAGATGSGKSVCINSIIVSLLYKATPQEVRLLLIDPKMVELAPYNRLPHLITPVVTDPKQATAALKWAVQEMDGRYEKFAEAGARDIKRYNELMRRNYPDQPDLVLPSIVIIIDELADLMMVAPGDVEEAICRIAQKARACGIHLLVATQRPSVDVITGLIKANIPTRVAFSVSSQTDSRTILDMGGAERLLGRGDMLYSSGVAKPQRLQGPYVSDEEIEAVTEYVRSQGEPQYIFEKEDLNHAVMNENLDELFAEVVRFCVENGQASASLLQRSFQIGYNRAARLIDMMEEKGFVSGYTGSSKPRDVFLTRAEYSRLFESGELE